MDQPRLRLAFLASHSWSDAEQVLWWLGRGLQELGHEVVWVCPESSNLATEARRLGQASLTMPSSALHLFGWLELSRRLRRIGVDCVIENETKKGLPILWGMLQQLNIRKLVLQHASPSNPTSIDNPFFVQVISNLSNQERDSERSLPVGIWPGETGLKTEARRWCLDFLNLPSKTRLICSMQGLCYTPQQEEDFHSHLMEAANHLRWHADSFCNVILSDDHSISRSQQKAKVYNLGRHVRFVRKDVMSAKWLLGADVAVCGQGKLAYSLPELTARMARTPVLNLGSMAAGQPPQDPGATAAWLLQAMESNTNPPNTSVIRLHLVSWNAIDMSKHMEQILIHLIGLAGIGRPALRSSHKSRLAG